VTTTTKSSEPFFCFIEYWYLVRWSTFNAISFLSNIFQQFNILLSIIISNQISENDPSIYKNYQQNTKLIIIIHKTIIESILHSRRMNLLANTVSAVTSNNEDVVIAVPSNKLESKASLEGSDHHQGTGYNHNEDFIAWKSFIAASEDAISGAFQIGLISKQKM
jgi:hypothetical protein